MGSFFYKICLYKSCIFIRSLCVAEYFLVTSKMSTVNLQRRRSGVKNQPLELALPSFVKAEVRLSMCARF